MPTPDKINLNLMVKLLIQRQSTRCIHHAVQKVTVKYFVRSNYDNVMHDVEYAIKQELKVRG